MPEQSSTKSNTADLESKSVPSESGSRRGFMALSALVVASFAEACASSDGGSVPGGGGGASSATGGAANPPGGAGTGAGGAPGGGLAGAPGGVAGTPGGVAGGTPTGAGGAGTGTGGTPGTGGTSTGTAGAGSTTPPMTGTWKENNFTPLPAIPSSAGMSNPKLPDPFKFISGTRITAKDDWEKLRADLSALLQSAVYGPKMPKPDMLTATFSGGKVTVNMTVGSKTGSFSFSITGGGTMAAPVPCIITCNGTSLPIPSGIATITLNTDTFAKQDKAIPTNGLVTTLYGDAAAKSGSDICWAWGLSRIIDALELVPEAGIDVHAIGATGCSYAGKGALAMGCFDERVCLTIVQEGGSGGTALWRVSTAEAKAGQNIQEATEIVGEQNWEGKDFKTLFTGKAKTSAPVDQLIADQHFAVALCAPRAILIVENNIDWLGPVATYGGGIAGRAVFEALGIKDRCGVSVSKTHGHCTEFPSTQSAYLNAFCTRFLKKGTADTSGVDELNTSSTTSKLGKFNTADWIDWTTPTLTGALPWDPFA